MAEGHGAAANAHTEADGGHHGGFPPFESHTFASQVVSLAIAFAALYVIVSRLAVPRVGGIIEARQQKIDGDLAEARRLRDESDAALKAYEADLAAARTRAQNIGNEAREKLSAQSDAERKTLEQELAKQLAAAEQAITATRSAAMANVRSIAVDAAGAIVKQLSGATADGPALNAAVDASLKG